MSKHLYSNFDISKNLLKKRIFEVEEKHENNEKESKNTKKKKENAEENESDKKENYSGEESEDIANQTEHNADIKSGHTNLKKDNTADEWKKYENDKDIKIAVKIATQHILSKQPFPVKKNDLFHIINYHLPNCVFNSNKRKAVIKLSKKYMREILGLNLIHIAHKSKTEYVLSQNILYEPHNDLLLSQLDHTTRGFLIFLFPFFIAHNNKIPLGYLLHELEDCGWKTTKTISEIINLVYTHTHVNRENLRNSLNNAQEMCLLDLFLYVKLLGYLEVDTENKSNDESLEGYYCIPTTRYEKEMSFHSYIKKLLQIPDKYYDIKDLHIIFGKENISNMNGNIS